MKGIRAISNRVIRPFMNSSLSMKLMLGYIFIVLLPTVTLEALFYQQNVTWVYNQYVMNEKSNLESSINNFMQKVQQVEPLTDVFQANSSLLAYMEGSYLTEGDELYAYLKNISPILSYARSSIKIVNTIQIYKYKKTHFSLYSDVLNMEKFKGTASLVNSLGVREGKWLCAYSDYDGFMAKYYKSIYTKGYTEKLGFAEITLKGENLFDTFGNLSEKLYLVLDNDNRVLRYDGEKFSATLADDRDASDVLGFLRGGMERRSKKVISSVHLSKLGMSLVYLMNDTGKFNYQGASILVLLVILIVILSVLYYVVFTSISRRIIALDRHIANSPADALTPMADEKYRDEIGSLTISYNNMIDRINNLIDRAYKAELLKKDAEFYALHTQLKPHFLYNILENIRMCAESNNDPQTSDMIFTLVKFMRYNLSTGVKEVTLEKEIGHIQNYLDIYRIRMGRKLGIAIRLETEIDMVQCPQFILQPIVENAIKHGLKGKPRGMITITASGSPDNDVNLCIADNGRGMAPEELAALNARLENGERQNGTIDDGIGLSNVNERLVLYYGPGYGLKIHSILGKGTTVTMSMKRESRR